HSPTIPSSAIKLDRRVINQPRSSTSASPSPIPSPTLFPSTTPTTSRPFPNIRPHHTIRRRRKTARITRIFRSGIRPRSPVGGRTALVRRRFHIPLLPVLGL
ncbi:MAG: hypothetical protein Q9228_007649, partial [Teloschistes exilis]